MESLIFIERRNEIDGYEIKNSFDTIRLNNLRSI